MSRLAQCFAALQQQRRSALIPFVTAGDPHPDWTVELMHTLVTAGADIVELGIPFSDPMAEGPVIQRASERALRHHVSLRDVLAIVSQFRQQNQTTPVVLMGYLNPIEVMGYTSFAAAAAAAGADGVITVDLPPEEGADYISALKSQQLDPVFLLAPTSTVERIKKICALAAGFVYYVSLKGVTGANSLDVVGVGAKLKQIRQYTQLPLGVGFGIKDAATAAQVAGLAEAVVIGSAIVRLVENNADDKDKMLNVIETFINDIRQAMDNQPA